MAGRHPSSVRPPPPDLQARVIQQARDAAQNCQYEPALRDGRPAAATVRKTFGFVV